MTTREDFSADYRLGQKVDIVLWGGTLCWSGTLFEIGERRIKLKMDDGSIRSVCYEGIMADYISVGTESGGEAHGSDAAAGEGSLLGEGILAVRGAEYEWEFDPASLKEQIRLSPNIEQKRMIMALADNLSDAEEAEDFEMIDKIVAAGLSLLSSVPDSAALKRLIGEAALLAEDFETAEEELYAAEMYAEAFYAAWMMDSRDKMAEDGACHLLFERRKIVPVVEMYVRLAADAGDLSVFRRFVEIEGKDYADLTACCFAYLLARKHVSPGLDERSLASPENFGEMYRLFLSNYPDPENSQLERMEEDSDKADSDQPEDPITFSSEALARNAELVEKFSGKTEISGTIFSYKPEQKIGFIRAENTDWFFHVNHVEDSDLAAMMEEDPEGQYYVYFDVGCNSRGVCATNVRLRDKDNPKAKPDPALLVDHKGIITKYFPFYSNGQITEGENVYNFRLSFVTDDTLKNYCEMYQDVVQREFSVIFRLKMLKDGKLVATDVRLEDPDSVKGELLPESGWGVL